MSDEKDHHDHMEYRQYGELDNDDPRLQVKILALRIDNLTREKEHIEAELKEEERARKDLDIRVASMEKSFQRGAGALIVMPVVGTFVGLLLAYGRTIFAPWMPK